MIHDVEYYRDFNRYRADANMVANLDRIYGHPFFGRVANIGFTLDDLFINSNRTHGNRRIYNELLPKAKKLIEKSGYSAKFGDDQ
jgi:hypothetical protein